MGGGWGGGLHGMQSPAAAGGWNRGPGSASGRSAAGSKGGMEVYLTFLDDRTWGFKRCARPPGAVREGVLAYAEYDTRAEEPWTVPKSAWRVYSGPRSGFNQDAADVSIKRIQRSP